MYVYQTVELFLEKEMVVDLLRDTQIMIDLLKVDGSSQQISITLSTLVFSLTVT